MRIAISSGHGKYVSGAVGPSPWGLHEHNEAVRVVDAVTPQLNSGGNSAVSYEDTTSRTQQENLNRIVNWHNSQTRDYDVSVHFNSNGTTTGTRGCEVYYYSQQALAASVSSAMSSGAGFTNRGAKKNTGLYFLNSTNKPAILLEVCFVNAQGDVNLYQQNFAPLCTAIAQSILGQAVPEPVPPEPPSAMFRAEGRMSWFGGPNDTGVSASEGLAFIYNYNEAPHLFLPTQPPNTTGLARRLNPDIFYVACRWDYNVTPKTTLARPSVQALVSANGKAFFAWPADWGPHGDTNRVADLSPGLCSALGLTTDDTCEVIYPAPVE